MNESAAMPEVDRRSLLRAAILLVGGSLAGVPNIALAATADRFFTPAQFTIMSEMADIIMPRTASPGAKDAGVPDFLDALMTNWASDSRQSQFRALFDEVGGVGFMNLDDAGRVSFMRNFDAGKIRVWDPAYVKFKELVLTLYYLSEAGATKELRYELIPGKWEPWTEISPDAPAWAV
jgi:gluconate 2-dehydrogenase gamma chain